MNKKYTFTNPKGQSLTVNSPDGSVPTEAEIDEMFRLKFGETQMEPEKKKLKDLPYFAPAPPGGKFRLPLTQEQKAGAVVDLVTGGKLTPMQKAVRLAEDTKPITEGIAFAPVKALEAARGIAGAVEPRGTAAETFIQSAKRGMLAPETVEPLGGTIQQTYPKIPWIFSGAIGTATELEMITGGAGTKALAKYIGKSPMWKGVSKYFDSPEKLANRIMEGESPTELLKGLDPKKRQYVTEILKDIQSKVKDRGIAGLLTYQGEAPVTPQYKKASEVIDKTIPKAVKPSSRGLKSASLVEKSKKQYRDAVIAITDKLDKIILPSGSKIPQNMADFSQAIEQSRELSYDTWKSLERQAGTSTPIAFDKVINAITDEFMKPTQLDDVRNEASKLIVWLNSQPRKDLSAATEIIQNLNSTIKNNYASHEFGSKGKVYAKALDILREEVDTVISNKVGPGWQEARREYGALRNIEKDVNRALERIAKKTNPGLYDSLVNTYGTSTVLGGIISGIPDLITRGLAAKGIGHMIARSKDPNLNIKKMFEEVNKIMETVEKPAPVSVRSTLGEEAAEAQRFYEMTKPKGSQPPTEQPYEGTLEYGPRGLPYNEQTQGIGTLQEYGQEHIPIIKKRIKALADTIPMLSKKGMKNEIADTRREILRLQNVLKGMRIPTALEAATRRSEAPSGGGRPMSSFNLSEAEKRQISKLNPDGVRGLNLTKDITVKDVFGNTKTYKAGESIFIYEDKGAGKAIVKDGDYGVLQGGQLDKLEQSGNAWGDFAPELKDVKIVRKEEIKPGKSRIVSRERFNSLERSAPKYSQYQLPGGENYREVLIKAPTKKSMSYEEFSKMKPGEARTQELVRRSKEELGQFKSSHWDEPNVLAHMRMNDRYVYTDKPAIDKKGREVFGEKERKKVLFLEEIQSDWAREVREKGIKNIEKFTAERNSSGTGWLVYDNEGQYYKDVIDRPQIKTAEDAIQFATKEFGVSTHPLLKNWQELSLKKALKEAVDGGYDYLSWTTGEQQAERYDLSKQVDKLVYWKDKNGDWSISAYRDNLPVIEEKAVPDKQLESFVPKETARKMREGYGEAKEVSKPIEQDKPLQDYIRSQGMNWKNLSDTTINELRNEFRQSEDYYKTLSGQDLKIGGEWARNLYDRQIPSILEDLTGEEISNINLENKLLKSFDDMTPQDKKALRKLSGGDLRKELENPQKYSQHVLIDEFYNRVDKLQRDPDFIDEYGEDGEDYEAWSQVLDLDTDEAEDFVYENIAEFEDTKIENYPLKPQQAIKITPRIKELIYGQPMGGGRPSQGVRLYHGTSPENKAKILKEGFSKKKLLSNVFDGFYFFSRSSDLRGTENYGDATVKAKTTFEKSKIFDFTKTKDLDKFFKDNQELYNKMYSQEESEGYGEKREYLHDLAFDMLDEIAKHKGKNASKYFQDQGYKGVAYYEELGDVREKHYVVFNPKDIKTLGGLALAAGIAGSSSSSEAKTLGQKNNNPGNLKGSDKWVGKTGKDSQGHIIFDTLEHGIRALKINIRNHSRVHPNQTLKQYMNSYAEANGTKEAEYIAGKMGITIDTPLKKIDTNEMAKHIAWFESRIKID